MVEQLELDDRWQQWSGREPRMKLNLKSAREEIREYIQLQGSTTTGEQQRYRDFNEEALGVLRERYAFDKFEISAEVVVVDGENKVCICNQLEVIETIYGVDMLNTPVIFFADIRNNELEENETNARIIYSRKVVPENPNMFVVSAGLARELKINNGDSVVISRIYQDMDKLNLDDLVDSIDKA